MTNFTPTRWIRNRHSKIYYLVSFLSLILAFGFAFVHFTGWYHVLPSFIPPATVITLAIICSAAVGVTFALAREVDGLAYESNAVVPISPASPISPRSPELVVENLD